MGHAERHRKLELPNIHFAYFNHFGEILGMFWSGKFLFFEHCCFLRRGLLQIFDEFIFFEKYEPNRICL